jgi:rhamnose utilization protein RhaD (predicted bifunctional aldolase and dehydrogenase)
MPRPLLPLLVRLSRDLAREDRTLAILGEGNTGADAGDGTFWVKASGTRMAVATPTSFVRVRRASVLALLNRRGRGKTEDAAVMAGLRSCVVGSAGVQSRASRGTSPQRLQPSTETFLHALAQSEAGATWVGHTHPVGVLGILCSRRGAKPFLDAIFPDEVVYCGLVPAVVPYVNPGVDLAFAFRDSLRAYRKRHGHPPRLVLLVNHGIVALGETPAEVLNISLMAEKWARVLLGTLAAGGPRPLTTKEGRHIDSWPAEHFRRRLALGKIEP